MQIVSDNKLCTVSVKCHIDSLQIYGVGISSSTILYLLPRHYYNNGLINYVKPIQLKLLTVHTT